MAWRAAAAGLMLCALAAPAAAQEAVTGVADAEALFTSPDPKLNANKQAAYHIVKDLLECGQWNQADRWLTERYIQHNPLAASGRQSVVDFFTKVMKVQPRPCPARMTRSVTAVIAEGDYVTVLFPREMTDKAGKPYVTSWFDTWRFVDGKADEHWDPATR